MLRTSRSVSATPAAVLRAIGAEADVIREPPDGHPGWKQRFSRVRVRQVGEEFRIRFREPLTGEDGGTPELRGSAAASSPGESIIHATCGYGWSDGPTAAGLLAAALLVWMTGSSWGLWLAGMDAVVVVAGRVKDVRLADRPDRYMLYLLERLDAALDAAAGGSSTDINTGGGADGGVGSGSV